MEEKISDKEYKKIVELVPILCVDIILRHNNKYVLVKRNNEPLKGFHWVIGGRLLKDESVWEGAMRKVREEVGVGVGGHEVEQVFGTRASVEALHHPLVHIGGQVKAPGVRVA